MEGDHGVAVQPAEHEVLRALPAGTLPQQFAHGVPGVASELRPREQFPAVLSAELSAQGCKIIGGGLFSGFQEGRERDCLSWTPQALHTGLNPLNHSSRRLNYGGFAYCLFKVTSFSVACIQPNDGLWNMYPIFTTDAGAKFAIAAVRAGASLTLLPPILLMTSPT